MKRVHAASLIVAFAGGFAALTATVSAQAATKPKDQCSNLRGIQKAIPKGYKRGTKLRCVKITRPSTPPASPPPPPPPPDPTVQWAPSVETFYKDTLTSIQTLASVVSRFGSLQPGELDNAINGLSACEAVLARDTGATPTTAAAQGAMAQLHTVCALLTKAAGEIRAGIASIDATQITAATTDIQGAVSLLKSVVVALGQPG